MKGKLKMKVKSKNFMQRVGYGIFSDMFCENDFSLCSATKNRKFKKATLNNAMKIYEFRKRYKDHGIIDN